jgi:hypothetical protein
VLTLIKVSDVHDILLTLPFYVWNDLFVFWTCEYLILQTYIYIVLSFSSLFQECPCLLHRADIETVDFKTQESFLRKVGTSHLCTFWFLKGEKMCISSHGCQWICSSQVWRQTIRSSQERSLFKDLIKGCTTHLIMGPTSQVPSFPDFIYI